MEEELHHLNQRNKELEEENQYLKNQIVIISNTWDEIHWKDLIENDKMQERINALNELMKCATKISELEKKKRMQNR
uniref:Uncharacterized protein n=1 Tax=Panagrolaimus sp. PS1159 TaxID=55785 RepID=A0AC35F825_9BILA